LVGRRELVGLNSTHDCFVVVIDNPNGNVTLPEEAERSGDGRVFLTVF
jgi:hypothetical protein